MFLKFGQAAMYERLLKERERVLTALADEVDYLRAQLALRGTHVPGSAANPSAQSEIGVPLTPYVMEVKNHIPDEELDLQALAEREGLNPEQVREIAEELGMGLGSTEINLDNWNVN